MDIPAPKSVAETAKVLVDLDALLRNLRLTLGNSKTWQRQLSGLLDEADRLMQVLRLTIAMERDEIEVGGAAQELWVAVKSTSDLVSKGRADLSTKSALQLGASLAKQLRDTFLVSRTP